MTSMLPAVIEADHQRLITTAGLTPGTTPHLASAKATLETLVRSELSMRSNSALALRISELLDGEKLFEVIGRYPPDQTPGGGAPIGATGGGVGRYCRHCGAANP